MEPARLDGCNKSYLRGRVDRRGSSGWHRLLSGNLIDTSLDFRVSVTLYAANSSVDWTIRSSDWKARYAPLRANLKGCFIDEQYVRKLRSKTSRFHEEIEKIVEISVLRLFQNNSEEADSCVNSKGKMYRREFEISSDARDNIKRLRLKLELTNVCFYCRLKKKSFYFVTKYWLAVNFRLSWPNYWPQLRILEASIHPVAQLSLKIRFS